MPKHKSFLKEAKSKKKSTSKQVCYVMTSAQHSSIMISYIDIGASDS
jgi:hypothetical protein